MSLHDGNHYPNQTKTADYKARVETLFSGIDHLIEQLEKEHRKVMIIMIPEHGANIEGDSLQMSGLRDIPNYNNTNVPVGIRFTGLSGNHPPKTLLVDQPSSYLAMTEIIKRSIDGSVFKESQNNWLQLVNQLPQTAPISENENVKAILLNNKQYFSESNNEWLEYK